MDQIDTISRLLSAGKRFVVCTLVSYVGSTPRKPGAQILVLQNGKTYGTIGGGALEHQVIVDAKDLFDGGETAFKNYDLTKELGMCCGGKVDIFFERMGPSDQLFLFGAGHVVQPLAAIAKWALFSVTVIDERSDYLTEERFPLVERRYVMPFEDALSKLEFSETTSVVVCTHDHSLDQKIVENCLSRPFRYLGLIGSQVKAAKTRARLKAQGFSQTALDRLRCPMGLDLGGQSPGEIATSVVAELISVRYRKIHNE